MLSIRKLQILDACANAPELFYFPFAEVTYGGSVVPASLHEAGPRRFERFADEGPWPVEAQGEDVARDIASLIDSGFLKCWRVSYDPLDSRARTTDPAEQISGVYNERIEIRAPGEGEFAAYTSYDCLTWEEHMERFGYGPHEFETTEEGAKELHLPIYDRYARRLGWG